MVISLGNRRLGGFSASEIMGQKGFPPFGNNVYTVTCYQTLSFIHPLSKYQTSSSLRYQGRKSPLSRSIYTRLPLLNEAVDNPSMLLISDLNNFFSW